jgi:hypothetical protein
VCPRHRLNQVCALSHFHKVLQLSIRNSEPSRYPAISCALSRFKDVELQDIKPWLSTPTTWTHEEDRVAKLNEPYHNGEDKPFYSDCSKLVTRNLGSSRRQTRRLPSLMTSRRGRKDRYKETSCLRLPGSESKTLQATNFSYINQHSNQVSGVGFQLQHRNTRTLPIESLIVDALWHVPNTVMRRDLQIPRVKEEIRRYSSQYNARLSAHPNDPTANLMELPDNRRLCEDACQMICLPDS